MIIMTHKLSDDKAKEEFRRFLIRNTGCTMQQDKNGKPYPCGTCTIDLMKRMGMKESKQHNKPVDRLNEVWRGILQVRGDKEA